MITIAYMSCSYIPHEHLCQQLKSLCKGVDLCLVAQNITASWKELSLALLNTLNAIRTGKAIAKKIDFEFYIRFFVERQITTILNSLTRATPQTIINGVLLAYHDDSALPCIKALLNKPMIDDMGINCVIMSRPEDELMHKFYSDYIKYHLGNIVNVDPGTVQAIVLGIIGCNDILLKD